MNGPTPRLRMFAGPNGSGKTTVKNELPSSLFGTYINPDELEKTLRETGVLDLTPFGVAADTIEVRQAFLSSEFLRKHQLNQAAGVIECRAGLLDLRGLAMNSYYASVLADFLRRKLLNAGISFSFETVMSARDKVELLREAQARGFRTYLYYVATEDPAINIERVKYRVAEGGHDVPETKIVERYARSLQLLREAIRHTNRAYFFDTSEETSWWFAEITNGTDMNLKGEEMPKWFRNAVWDVF